MKRLILALAYLCSAVPGLAQQSASDRLVIGTVTRAPFSFVEDGRDTGYGIDLWDALAAENGLEYDLRRYETFSDMLLAVQSGEVNGAVANISITEEREKVMDFTQPIFSAGIQIMMPMEAGTGAVMRAALTPRLLLMMGLGILAVLALGMLMWLFERRRQAYFGNTAKEAAFPAFWWALHLLISGDYRAETPISPLGRIFGSLMVIGSLFIVSLFVANVTANLTLNALSRDIERITDLDGRRVGTTEASTTSSFLSRRGVTHQTFPDLETLYAEFEAGNLDAVAFDGPILAYYAQTRGQGKARVLDRVFQREYYGIVFPTGSPLRETVNQTLLRFEEGDVSHEIELKWFGSIYADK
ncbi:transporter substrate-binding domain-containing protein [Jannaschia pohangensis]|nr:transporter substrate-binding domain-containing protein [Jannaschia pohangensis]